MALNDEQIEALLKKAPNEITQQERMQIINYRMKKIKYKIAVISGKGGVGKSTIAVNLAMGLATRKKAVGLMDLDITGPNVARMTATEGMRPEVNSEHKSFIPVNGPLNVKIMSMAFLLASSDDPVIWRGPMKMGLVRQFLGEGEWGALDYLVIDLPPGTGDEILDILQLIPDAYVLIVTTPQDVALLDSRKTAVMAKTMQHEILGFIENMSGFICPKCKEFTPIFGQGGTDKASVELDVEILGKIPIETEIRIGGDMGTPFLIQYPDSASAKEFNKILDKIQKYVEEGK
jgi:ATP-binding protein involved in chromosome partitioning